MGHPLRVVVVGAGIVGLCCARSLAEGHEVTVVDEGDRNTERCSVGNSGIIVPSHFVPLAAPGMVGLGLRLLLRRDGPFGFSWPLSPSWMWRFAQKCNAAHVEAAAPRLLEMHRASLAEYERLASDLGEIGFAKKGLLLLFQTPAEWEHEKSTLPRAERFGAKAAPVLASDFARYLPGTDVRAVGGVYFEEDAHLTPKLVQEKLIVHLEGQGVRFLFGQTATGFATEGRAIKAVKTSVGELEADQVVLAAGSWTPSLCRSLGLRLPMLAGMGCGVTATRPPEPFETPAILVEARVAVTPMADGVRFGGTMELGGTGRQTNPRRFEGMLRSVAELFPKFTRETFRGEPVWSGMRPCSPDGLPYVGRTAAADNCLVATGHAMMGMSLGPITGKLVAEMAAGRPTSLDCSLFNPDRYA